MPKKQRRRVSWQYGDVFAVPLLNGRHAVGQILDQRLVNTVRIALFDEVLDSIENPQIDSICNESHLISLIEVTKEQLDYGVWKVIGNKEGKVPVSRYPNEQFRELNWVGSIISDAGLAEDFLNAFHALIPWDDWYDPNYLDRYLVDISKKPGSLIFIKS